MEAEIGFENVIFGRVRGQSVHKEVFVLTYMDVL